jgi:hypothetical protein
LDLSIKFGGGCFVETHLALALADERGFEVADEDGEADFELFRRRIVFGLGGGLMERVRLETGDESEQ